MALLNICNLFHLYPQKNLYRDFFADKDGKDYICSTAPFRDLFNSHKSHLKTFGDIETYLHENIKLRFFIIPKMKRESLYIELAEAISHHDEKLPLQAQYRDFLFSFLE